MAAEWDVFLSYSWADLDLVLRIKHALEEGGLRVFRDADIPQFNGITESLVRALDASKLLVAVYSRRYPTRYACQWELTKAFLAGQRAGNPRDRVLVINVERDEAHIQPIELEDAGYLSAYGGRIDLELLVRRVLSKVAEIDEPMGAIQGASPPLPHRLLRPRRFVGRYEAMWRVHSALHAGQASAVHPPTRTGAVVIKGFTGTGKSSLAEQYAFLFRDAFPGGVFWTDGGSQPIAELRRTAREQLGLALDGVEPDRVVPAIVEWLNARAKHALWILDDVVPTDESSIGSPFVHVVFTTKEAPDWPGPIVETEGLTDTEAQELFGYEWQNLSHEDRDAVTRLVRRCGGHPFVLADTVLGLRSSQGGTHAHFAQRLDAAATSVVDVLRARLRTISAQARDVLAAASTLATAPFHADLLAAAFGTHVGPVLSELDDSNLVQRLDRFGSTGGSQSWRVHALVAKAVREELPAADLDVHAVTLAEVLLSVKDAQVHARALADREAVPVHVRARLLRRVASFHAEQGDLLLAEDAAAAMLRLSSGVSDLLLATRTALAVGDYASALERGHRAIDRAEADDNYRDAFRARFLVAQVHDQQGRYAEADEAFPRREIPGWLPADERREVELARVTGLRLRGEIAAAYDLVTALTSTLPRDDVWAAAMIERTRLELAKTSIMRARETSAEVVGALLDRGSRDHPLCVQAIGLRAEAELQVALTESGLREPEWERAAEQISALHAEHERKLGQENPLTLQFAVLKCRALVHRGQPVSTLECVDEVKPRVERVFGSHHSLHHRVCYSEAQAFMQQRRYQEGRRVLETLLPQQVATLGRHHLDSLTTRLDLGLAYLLTNSNAEGRRLLLEAARELHRQYGWSHEVGFRAKITALYGVLPGPAFRILVKLVNSADRKNAK